MEWVPDEYTAMMDADREIDISKMRTRVAKRCADRIYPAAYTDYSTQWYYPHERELVWHEVTDLRKEELWYAKTSSYRPIVGNRSILRYPGLPGTRFTGVFECEIISLTPCRHFSMLWTPQVRFGPPARYEMTFTFRAALLGTCLNVTLSGLESSSRAGRAIRYMFARGMEQALGSLGVHLDRLDGTGTDHIW